MARKLAVAVWYLMMGRWTPLEEIDDRLVLKVGKMIRQVETKHLNQRGKARHDWRDEIYDRLKNVKVYQLDPHKKFTPASRQPVMAVAQP
jgi:hypothetical protein